VNVVSDDLQSLYTDLNLLLALQLYVVQRNILWSLVMVQTRGRLEESFCKPLPILANTTHAFIHEYTYWNCLNLNFGSEVA